MGQPARTGGYRASVTRWGCTAGYNPVLSVRSILEDAPQNADARVGRAITLHLLDDPVAIDFLPGAASASGDPALGRDFGR